MTPLGLLSKKIAACARPYCARALYDAKPGQKSAERAFCFFHSFVAIKLVASYARLHWAVGIKGGGKSQYPIFDRTTGRIAALLLACVARHTALRAPCTASRQRTQKRYIGYFRLPKHPNSPTTAGLAAFRRLTPPASDATALRLTAASATGSLARPCRL